MSPRVLGIGAKYLIFREIRTCAGRVTVVVDVTTLRLNYFIK